VADTLLEAEVVEVSEGGKGWVDVVVMLLDSEVVDPPNGGVG